jgi:hypothetical protein
LAKIILKLYNRLLKKLFGSSDLNHYEDMRDDIPQVSDIENELLIESFSKK